MTTYFSRATAPLAVDARSLDWPVFVLAMSGYTDDDVMRGGLLEQGVPFLEKPLAPEALTRTMRKVLGRDLPIG